MCELLMNFLIELVMYKENRNLGSTAKFNHVYRVRGLNLDTGCPTNKYMIVLFNYSPVFILFIL